MIHTIPIPMYREVSQEGYFLERVKFGDESNPDHPSNVVAEMSQDATKELDKYLSDGYTIMDTYDTRGQTTTYRLYVLFKADDKPKVQQILDFAYEICRKQTYSKSTQQHFDFWRLTLCNGRMVNVFNHPDDTRNTFKIAIDEGWQAYFEQCDLDSTYRLPVPIPVTVSVDGDWLKLEQIANFTDMEGHYDMALPSYSDGDDDEAQTESE